VEQAACRQSPRTLTPRREARRNPSHRATHRPNCSLRSTESDGTSGLIRFGLRLRAFNGARDSSADPPRQCSRGVPHLLAQAGKFAFLASKRSRSGFKTETFLASWASRPKIRSTSAKSSELPPIDAAACCSPSHFSPCSIDGGCARAPTDADESERRDCLKRCAFLQLAIPSRISRWTVFCVLQFTRGFF
jgi:hypothetical protein